MRRRLRVPRLPVPLLIALACGLLTGGVGTGAYVLGLLDRVDLAAVDSMFAIREDPAKARDVVVVAIDENTFTDLKVRWPMSRVHHARVVDRLRAAKVRAIAYDVQFSERTNPRADEELLWQLYRARRTPTILASVLDQPTGGLFGDSGEAIEVTGVTPALASQVTDADGVIRRFESRSESGVPTFAAAVAAQASGRRLAARSGWIDWAGEPYTIDVVSFSDVARGRVPAAALRDKIAVVGATDPALHDLHAVPTSGRDQMPGPEVQANVIQTLLNGAPLRRAARGADIGLIVGAALIGALALLLPRRLERRPVARTALGFAIPLVLCAGLVGGLLVAFASGVLLTVAYPLAAFGLATVFATALLVSYDAGERARRRLREAFGRFVPEQAVDEVMASASGRHLRGVERDATVMFADLRGFTDRSQRKSAQDVIEFLNHYLSEMSEAILAQGGTVVSYMGDGLMAVFGAPLEQEDAADRALAAARDMAGSRLERFNEWLGGDGPAGACTMSIGLHSGPVASGTVGGERRLEYAAVGHTTNVAARLESLTRQVGYGILVSETTHARLREPAEDLVRVGGVDVRGVEEPVVVWGLFPDAPPVRAAA